MNPTERTLKRLGKRFNRLRNTCDELTAQVAREKAEVQRLAGLVRFWQEKHHDATRAQSLFVTDDPAPRQEGCSCAIHPDYCTIHAT